MTRTLPRIQTAMRDMLGSWDAVDHMWQTMREEGRLIERRTGPETALYEFASDEPIALWVGTVDAQHESWKLLRTN